jgi:Zn-dependent M28 family amino/carboxypeptidase
MAAAFFKSGAFWLAGALVLILLVLAASILYGTRVPGRSHRGPLAPLREEERTLEGDLRRHVAALAGEIGERNLFLPEKLEAAENYIRSVFMAHGYDGSSLKEQLFSVQGNVVRNLMAEVRGTDRPEEIVILGAHYDSVAGSPGANDNASGVAAMLALSRVARRQRFARTVRFVAFVNEEPPFFTKEAMGSRVYAHSARAGREDVVAMLSLETIGYYSDARKSQAYPAPFGLLYPDTGNFITFVSNYRSRTLLHQVMSAFRGSAQFPSEGAAAPEWVPGVGWSDHWSFWKEGYPGVMVTDTALFRYPHYHTAQDTPDKLDYPRMARVVAGLQQVLHALAK